MPRLFSRNREMTLASCEEYTSWQLAMVRFSEPTFTTFTFPTGL
jgi:hypothetical protein